MLSRPFSLQDIEKCFIYLHLSYIGEKRCKCYTSLSAMPFGLADLGLTTSVFTKITYVSASWQQLFSRNDGL